MISLNYRKRYNISMPKKKPLTDKERQTFVDNLPVDQRNADPKKVLDGLIERASTTPILKDLEQSAVDAGYSGKQTRLRKAEGTSEKHSDKSHQ